MRHDEKELEEGWDRLVRKLIRLVDLLIARLESNPPDKTKLQLTIQGEPMANYPLNAGDSVVATIADNDAVTGAVVTPDAGSVTAVLSSATDTVVVDPSGTFATITAGTALGTNNTVTVNATVGGVASATAVGTYDVVAAAADATTLSVTFGTESAPAAPAPASNTGTGAGQVNPVTGLINP